MTCEAVGELLLDYIEGELTSEQACSVKAHLDDCRACAAKYREMRALVGDLGVARSAEQSAWNSSQSRSRPIQPTVLAAHTRLGDFEILEELGRGGMGVVYRARQISLNRIVALKLLSAGLVQSERSVSRFTREAQAAGRLHHTNIVPIYAQGHEGDYFYYAMELVEGESLDQVLRRERESSSEGRETDEREAAEGTTWLLRSPTVLLRSAVSTIRLSRITHRLGPARDYKRIVRLAAGVAEGLHHAHEQGVVHRDIKPQNLLLGPDDELHITDFGLARVLDEPGLTRSTEMVGTPAYMSPEQITGPSTTIDRRTDVYSLGVTLYVMLTLRRPFQGETYEQTIHQILKREPRPPRRIDPRIPMDLETICLRAMEKEPRRRFPTAGEMAHDLRRYAEGFPIASRPVGPLGKAVRWTRRHPWRAGVMATSAVLVVVIPLLLSFFSTTANGEIDKAEAVLLDDYREWERARGKLSWVSRVGSDRYRRKFVEAFAHIRTEPKKSIELLEGLLEERPGDVDAHYLLAWAYVRRGYTQGVEMWADAERHIGLGDACRHPPDVEPSAAGWFFRAQAVWGSGPEEAVDSFDQALKAAGREGFTFTQAMLHQGRAMNQIMYSWRARDPLLAISYYEKAVGQLEIAADLQPGKAYPRYLLSITHYLAAEIYEAEGKTEAAERAYAGSLSAAIDAQNVQPTSPRGYAAEADYYESVGDYRSAIAAWNRYDDESILKTNSDWSERYAYQMRLHFWRGEHAEAEQMCAKRYGPPTGYDRRQNYDADDSFYEALIAASADDWDRAEEVLKTGVELAREHPEYVLRLHSAYRLIGRPPPAGLLPDETCSECRLSPGWTPEWLNVLTGYVRGDVDWSSLEAAAREGTERRDDERLRLAGAFFFRGVRELTDGRSEQALTSLKAACDQYDNENYCFRAKFLLIKLREDEGWPGWLGVNGAASP